MKEKKEAEPQYLKSKLNNMVVNYRVYIMKPAEKMMYSLLMLIAGGIVGLIFYGGLFKKDGNATMLTMISNLIVFVGVGIVALKVFLPTITEILRKRRLSKLKVQFRDFLGSVSTSLSSGLNVNAAFQNAYKDLMMQYSEEADMVQELKEILLGIQSNLTIEDMLEDFGNRSGVEDIKNFAIVFSISYRTGGNLKEVVRRTNDIISEKMMIAEEIETKLTSNKIQMKAMNVIPIVVMFMMRMMSSEFAESFSTFIGVIAVTIGAAFFIAAYKLGEKYTDIKG